ncbi:pentapeptide repeat-containing protein [Amycolatopsis sp. NPDC088138]|uniref:pentapeptide repeat-containing protein n=1 Tax=Amycolatopsis sp. NPDC088138 TaxID=3363938 RepID=UPI0037F142DB
MENDAHVMGRRRASGAFAAALALLLLGVVVLLDLINWSSIGRWSLPRAPWLATFAAAAVFTIIGGWTWRKPERPSRSQPPGLSWWLVITAGVVVGMVAWGATSWLLAEADSAKDRGSARVDAIKTGLGIGAGATGIFALLLAVRRQIHQEKATADTTLDATERRVTELYTKAVEQLGSPKAPVRLGGLYALERLGQNHPDQRATIVNVICAYLRMRYTVPAEPPEDASPDQLDRYEDRAQEAQVRITAQRILHRHREIPSTSPIFWDDVAIIIDLAHANMAGADLTLSKLVATDFTHARLADANFLKSNLSYSTFVHADLRDAKLRSVVLDGADLTHADLSDAELIGASLCETNLTHANLSRANLQGADLTGADLTRVDLRGANVELAKLEGTNLTAVLIDKDTRINLPPEFFALDADELVRQQASPDAAPK